MLLLVFEVGKNRYGIEASEIVEVLPIVSLKKVPHTPHYVAGLFSYRGTATPVIDLQALLGESAARTLLSTRIIIVRIGRNGDGQRCLGLMAEQVTETVRYESNDFQPAGVRSAPYLGEVSTAAGLFIQKVTVDEILSEELKSLLFEKEG